MRIFFFKFLPVISETKQTWLRHQFYNRLQLVIGGMLQVPRHSAQQRQPEYTLDSEFMQCHLGRVSFMLSVFQLGLL